MVVTDFAPAKVNLTLHVTGQRADGYHLLDSLVVFVGIGDRIFATKSEGLSLRVTGPNAKDVPTDVSNLVLKAAMVLQGMPPDAAWGADITLDKHLPPASGIGGGSSDAAATLRALSRLWSVPVPTPEAVLGLGADVPVCLGAQPCRMSGIGEVLADIPPLPSLHMVLVNPRQAVATPAVFKRLTNRAQPPMPSVPRFASAQDCAAWLSTQRNDLEPPAIEALPVIAEGLRALHATQGALLARMSGSGATCFGLYGTAEAAARAKAALAGELPGWWIDAGPVLTTEAAS